MNDTTLSIDIVTGTSKKDPANPREWSALKVTVGTWSKLIFASSKFELDYWQSVIKANDK